MTKGFVLGKFLPFHKGHEALINFALSKCSFVSVLVCASNNEIIKVEKRVKWISESFQGCTNLEIIPYEYDESDLPNSSESSEEISQIWCKVLIELFPDYDFIFSSEKYGEFIAKLMKISHIKFNQQRDIIPVSASMIRNNLFENWHYLPDSVKPDFAIKVVILGTESTGKSTLAESLSKHFNCSLVCEAGRDLVDNSNEFEYNLLEKIAFEHAKRIRAALTGESALIIIDTDIHTTMSYSEFIFGKKLKVNNEIVHQNKSDLYLYLTKDIVFVQDGTRLNERMRNNLDLSHRKVLRDNNIDFIEITGGWTDRFNKSITIINDFISNNPKKL